MKFRSIEDTQLFKELEKLCEDVWDQVIYWDWFGKQVIGRQLMQALDSAEVNLSEGEGRFYKKDQLRFMQISRGSLKEARRWLIKAVKRGLLNRSEGEAFVRISESVLKQLSGLIRYRQGSA